MLTFILPAPVKSKLRVFVEPHAPDLRDVLGSGGQQCESVATGGRGNLEKSARGVP